MKKLISSPKLDLKRPKFSISFTPSLADVPPPDKTLKIEDEYSTKIDLYPPILVNGKTIYISNIRAVKSDLPEQNGITLILNLSGEHYQKDHVDIINLDQFHPFSGRKHYEDQMPLLRLAVENHDSILVHCIAAQDRSPRMAAILLHHLLGIDIPEAINLVSANRPPLVKEQLQTFFEIPENSK